jgi:hypothetical protein
MILKNVSMGLAFELNCIFGTPVLPLLRKVYFLCLLRLAVPVNTSLLRTLLPLRPP